MNKIEIEKLVNKAKILGILTPIKTFCGGTCYLISKSKTDHIVIIPSDIERLNYNYVVKQGLPFTDYISGLKGTIKIIGGQGLKDTNGMFADCIADKIDISELSTNDVKYMQYMFYGSRIKSINLEALDTFNVTHMDFMFAQCYLRKPNFSNFNTHNVVSMYYMFFCSFIDDLDLSSFDIRKVVEMSNMFCSSCSDRVDLTSFKIGKQAVTKEIFKNANAKFIIKDTKLMNIYINKK